MKWLYVGYAFAWISTACAVAVGIWITKNPNCLWAMLIPAFIGIKSGNSE
jgi:hypothetical protein